MTSESSAASLWRFGVNTDQVQSRSTLEDDWEVTPELLSAFRQLAEVVCPILSRCKYRCKIARREGSLHGLKQLEQLLPTRTTTLSLQQLDDLSQSIIRQEQAHQHTTVAPLPPSPYPTLPEVTGLRTNHTGWNDVDTMYLEPEFRLGSFEFTKFYKHRTMEIRVAFVAGVRDVLTDLRCWAAANQTALEPATDDRGTLLLATLRTSIQDVVAELIARPFAPLETVPEEASTSLPAPRRLSSRRQSTSASSTTLDGTRHPSPSPIGMASLSQALPQARDVALAALFQADSLDNDDKMMSQPRAQRRKYATPTVAMALATAPTGPQPLRNGSPSRHARRDASQARLFGYAGHKRDERLDRMETDMEGEVGEEGSKRTKPMV